MIEAAVAKATAPLLERIAALEAELAKAKKNSSNSSKPPSSDLVKPPKPPRKDGKKRKRGGQPGHEQHLRADVSARGHRPCGSLHARLLPRLRRQAAAFRASGRRSATGGNHRHADHRHRTPRVGLLVPSLPQAALRPAAGSGREGGPVRPATDGPGRLHEGRLPRLVFHHPQVPPRRGAGERFPRLPGQADRQGERVVGRGVCASCSSGCRAKPC